MKKLFFVYFLLAFSLSAFTQETVYLPKHLVRDGDDTGSHPEWIYTADYTYNNHGQVTSYVSNYYNNSLGTSRHYGYDDAGRLIKFRHSDGAYPGIHSYDSTRYEYDGDLLIRKKTGYYNEYWFVWSGKEEYQYDDYARCVLTGHFGLDNYDNWYLKAVTTYEYSDDGLEQVMTYTKVDEGVQYRYIWHYDSDGNEIDVTYQKAEQGELVNNTYTEKTYVDGLLMRTEKRNWSTESNEWVNTTASTNIYNTNDWLIETLYMSWTDGAWQPTTRTLYDVDDNNLVHSVIYQDADILGGYVNTVKAQYDYDDRDLCVFMEEYSWVDGDWVANTEALKNEKVFWEARLAKEDELARYDNRYWNIGNTTIEWEQTVIYPYINAIDEQGSDGMVVYPNPAFDQLTIKTSKLEIYKITNLAGQVLQTGRVDGLIRQIDVKDLPVGLYLITIGGTTGKFIKI